MHQKIVLKKYFKKSFKIKLNIEIKDIIFILKNISDPKNIILYFFKKVNAK